MAGPFDLDGKAWELPPDIAATTVGGVVARAHLLENLPPSGLLAFGALSHTETKNAAAKLLMNQFGYDPARARAAVALASHVQPKRATNEPVGQIAGMKVSAAQAAFIAALVQPTEQANPQPAPGISRAETDRHWRLGRLQGLAKTAVQSGDPSVALVAAALMASNRTHGDLVARLTEAQFHTLMGRGTLLRKQVGHVLGAAYALAALDTNGMDLGHALVSIGNLSWRMRAAPWVLPILDENNGPAVQALLTAADARGLDFVFPGINPLPYDDDTGTFNDTLKAATVYKKRLTKWSERPLWFDGGPGHAQVLLTQDETYMYAWVGCDSRGVLVAFDTQNLVGYGLDEPGVRAALAHAIGWFVDVSISIRTSPAGTATIRRAAAGNAKSGSRYVPTPTYAKQTSDVVTASSKPPRLHVVQSHLRRYKNRKPSSAARARAPRRLRDLMGPQDTFVRGHFKGVHAEGLLDTRLSEHSMLADVIGLHQKAQAN